MPLGRRHERREERREDRRGGGQVHCKMRQRLVSIGDDFWIETDGGERAYKVDGKALHVPGGAVRCVGCSGRDAAPVAVGVLE